MALLDDILGAPNVNSISMNGAERDMWLRFLGALEQPGTDRPALTSSVPNSALPAAAPAPNLPSLQDLQSGIGALGPEPERRPRGYGGQVHPRHLTPSTAPPSAEQLLADIERTAGGGVGPFATTTRPDVGAQPVAGKLPAPALGPDADAIVRGAQAAAAARPPAQQAPAGAGGGDSFQNRLRGFFAALQGKDPRAFETESMTVRALTARGMDPTMAAVVARNPALLQSALGSMMGPRNPVVLPAGGSVLMPDGRVVQGNPPRREMSPSDIRTLRNEGSILGTTGRLQQTFQDRYSMPGSIVGGDVRNWMGRNLPEGMTQPQAREAASWWQDYYRNSELTERHELFGAALTATEQAAWRSAAINPNMNAATIRENLAQRQRVLSDAMRRYARSLVASGQDAAVVSEALGVPPSDLGVTPGGRGPGALGATPGDWNDLGNGVRIREVR